MNLLPAHHRQSLLPELNDLWNAVAPTGLAPMFGAHLLRLEDTVEDGRYIVRAEIPGIDPAKDVEVSVQGRQLTIKAERTEKKEERAVRSSTTGPSIDRSRCPRVPTRRGSKRPTPKASCLCRCRWVNRRRHPRLWK